MKKILLLLAMLLTFCTNAQNAVGDWRIHTSFVGNNVSAVVDAHNWVYCLSSANLFRLDKETQENEALSKINGLSDMEIVNIYYNSDKDYIVVVYSNSNLDVIQSDGSIINMPEIKDAVLTSSKKINDVTFADGVIYLATDFGYVVINDDKFIIKESHLYSEALQSVAQVGDLLLLSTTDKCYYGDADKYHDQLSSFQIASLPEGCRFRPINDHVLFCLTGWTFRASMTFDEGTVQFHFGAITLNTTTDVQKLKDGFLLNIPSLNGYMKTDEDGLNEVIIETDGEKCGCNPDGDGTIWAAGKQGLHILGENNYYHPNAMSFSTPFWMTYNKDNDLLYVSTPTSNAFMRRENPSEINTYDGIRWSDVTPEGAPESGTYWIEFVPGAPNTYLISSWRDGLYKVVNNEIVFNYNQFNSPFMENWAMHPITSIDRNGNLWVVQSFENPEHPVMVLPAAKVKLENTTANDWILPEIDGLYTKHTQRASFISTKNSNYDIKIFTDGDYQMPLFLWNNAGEISSRPPQVSFSELSDQDGQIVTWTYIMCLTEDLGGSVWMGTTEGVCVFNPAKAFSGSSFNVVRPKVPRNDGTGMADRLMDGIQVNDIAVDGANRKWIATQSSGIFLVNSDGTQIIKRFNTSNSPLASNTVYRICCNPNSNSVYMTTPVGLYEYYSDSGPAQSDYSDIYAYPNPVRPDYGGDVTIVGLMDNSLVKIADASGNVIRQIKSTGGMATWDCCDQYGERVKTGVYLVFCSQADASGNAAVTKIAVIR